MKKIITTLFSKKIDSLRGYQICPDVIFQIADEGSVLASNHRTKTHVLMNLSLFNALAGKSSAENLCACDRTKFTNTEGLLRDPTCLERSMPIEWVTFNDLAQALNYLAKHFIVIKDTQSYESYFAKKSSILDQKHLGTFHQRLGAELHLRLKAEPSRWWYEQKFNPDTGETRNNLYKFIQQHFLDSYLASGDLKGKAILDFGCGNGMASRRFCKAGAEHVIGVDPDKALLKEATRRCADNFQPIEMPLTEPDPLGALPKQPLDLIWMADVFMFYFYPHDATKSPVMAPEVLLKRLSSLLKPQGRIVIMQPHGVFWLLPWLGSAHQPYTLITEYHHRLYSVTPGLEEISTAISQAGLSINKIFEPRPTEEGASADSRAFHFAREFPLWWVFECQIMIRPDA